jgi:5-methyltetrahydrofolate--homocysteine methyltransferase
LVKAQDAFLIVSGSVDPSLLPPPSSLPPLTHSQVWQLRGKYPNRNYPNLFNDPDVGEEAKRVFNDAQELLKKIVAEKLLVAKGALGFYPCHGEGEDIVIYSDDDRTSEISRFFGIRQQAENVDPSKPYKALGDFVAPKESGVKDYIGLFAVSAGTCFFLPFFFSWRYRTFRGFRKCLFYFSCLFFS